MVSKLPVATYTVHGKILVGRKLANLANHELLAKIFLTDIKTHGRVSAAKEVVWHTSVLFTGTVKSPFSTHHISIISITTGRISIKFTYFMPSIYTTSHTKFEKIRLSSLQDICF